MITGGRSFVSSPPTFSNDAKRLLVCTGNTVSIFSTSTGLQTSELEGHSAQVTSVLVVPASNNVLCYCWTSSLDGTIKYWDFAAPELLRTIDIELPIHSMVIPGLLSDQPETTGKRSDLFAYVTTEVVKQKEGKTISGGQVQKCSLGKSSALSGELLAEIPKPGPITISTSGKYIGVCAKRTIRIWEIPAKDSANVLMKKIKLHHTKQIAALAFHPTEMTVAAGDVTGRILVWRGAGREAFSNSKRGGWNKDEDDDRPGVLGDDDAESCTTWHWHASQLNVLFFSSDGAYLYSGGKEGVLVVWQLDTGKKKFLPRIGSPLLYFINSPDPSLSSLSCADNRIHLLRMPSMEILKSISGIKLPSSLSNIYKGSGAVFNRTDGLVAVPTENYRVQFYSLFDDREVSEVQVCERNHHPGDEITVTVNLISLSPDGSLLGTVETRDSEEGIGSLVSLKFWAIGAQNKEFSLSTLIYEPHRDATVSCVAFHPTRQMAVSSSYGGDFKVWVNRQDISSKDQAHQSTGWTCHAVGSYKRNPMTAAAFSNDGSVLAVAAEKVITMWDPDRNILVAVMGDSYEPITSLSFVGKSEYLVSASHGLVPQLTMWNMSKLSASWSYRLHVQDISCSVDGATIAVLGLKTSVDREADEISLQGKPGTILLFNVESPVPLSTWRVSKAAGGRLSYIPLSSKLGDEVSEANEALAYINGSREYILFDPSGDHEKELGISRQRTFNNANETDKFGYASIYGQLPEFNIKVDQTQISSVASDKNWKTVFSGPSHTLPPLSKLCTDFLESLLERRPTSVN